MNTETKRHIDSARQVLVGVVPNPTSQIDQITNALIYKFMDDMDQSAIKQGGEPSFFIGDLKDYAWTRLMDTRIGNQQRMNIYSEALVKFSESKQLPQLFREIFKSAFLPYRSPEVLGLFLKEIDYFDYSHPEELGNAYEYLLSIMSSQGDAGQFRTPRHIIDFIVDVVNPTYEDKVLDPACGTGGFLVSAYKHILEQHDGKNFDSTKNNEKTLTPDQRKNLMGNFEGYDIDPGMVRIAQVNMYLHQFKNPKIYNYDTLSMEERWGDKFSVILANPPFMSPKGGVSTHNKFSIESSRSEVLFVDYIMNHLRPQGRAGIIVPEGIIFQSGTAYKQLRKNLVEDGLYAVVSLPPGVFQPYSGVKTSILLFHNELAKRNKEILFVKIENDGFDLGATKRPISKNDLPEALDILNKWKKGDKVESNKVVYVEKTKIAKNGDYNFSGDRYRISTDYTNAKWPIVELGEVVLDMKDGGTPSRSKSEYFGGDIHWAVVKDIVPEIYNTKERLTDKGLKNSSAKVWPIDSIIISLGATIGNVGVAKIPLATKQGLSGIIVNKEKIVSKYLYYILIDQKNFIQSLATGASIKEVRPTKLQQLLKIPLPPLKIQEQIVAELDNYQNITIAAKQIVTNWKPVIEIDPEWEKVKLVEVCDGFQYGSSKKSSPVGEIPCLRMGNIQNSEIDWSDLKYATSDEEFEKYLLKDKDVLFNRTNSPDLVGKTAIYRNDRPATFAGYLIRVLYRKDKLLGEYLNYCLNSESAKEFCRRVKTDGVSQSNINAQLLGQFEIALPSLEIQKQIVERIESERALVDGNKKLLKIYEQKIKNTLAKLWEK